MLGYFLENDDEMVKQQRDKLLTDEETSIEAEQEILDKKKKQYKIMKAELQENKEEVLELLPSEEDEVLIEEDPEDVEEDDPDVDIDEDMLIESMNIIKSVAKSYNILEELTPDDIDEDYFTDEENNNQGFYDPQKLDTETKLEEEEAKGFVNLSKCEKKNWLISRSALALARAAEDPNYETFINAEKLRRQALENMQKRYKTRSLEESKKLL